MTNEELRRDAELGRKARIAAEVLREFLDDKREDVVRMIEQDTYLNVEIPRALSMLQIIAEMNSYIQRGEIAEEELANGE